MTLLGNIFPAIDLLGNDGMMYAKSPSIPIYCSCYLLLRKTCHITYIQMPSIIMKEPWLNPLNQIKKQTDRRSYSGVINRYANNGEWSILHILTKSILIWNVLPSNTSEGIKGFRQCIANVITLWQYVVVNILSSVLEA